ncbi:rCG53404 [Rattus norvegicus]|uniref:RCG53404 n=1 Tax=Rattus norvegicus TaxID=10116 RepID=A6JRF1_RAT|nr:rCG53404 [Rattus norvegicus]
MVSLENIHTDDIIWTEYLRMHTQTLIYAITIYDKRFHELEGEKKGAYGRVWRKKRNIVIVLYSQK